MRGAAGASAARRAAAGIALREKTENKMCIRDRQGVTDYVHSLENGAYQIYWIPFYQSSGFRAWKTFGFDYAIMQPNYASVSYTHLDVYKRQALPPR